MALRSQELLNCGGEEEKTLQDLLDAVQRPEGGAPDDFDVKDVVPVPSFVIKTRDGEQKKTFINVCGCGEIPAPGDWSGGKVPAEVATALKAKTSSDEEKAALRFPLSLGAAREGRDKQGDPCVVYDCLFNLDIILAAKAHRKLKVFLIGLAIEWVSHKNEVQLSTDYKLPKMHYKGTEIESHKIKVRKDPMVQEIEKEMDSPSFPLPINKETQGIGGMAEATEKLQKLDYTLTYENRPVDAIVLKAKLPKNIGNVKPHVWISGFDLRIELPHITESLTVELPLAVDAEKAEVIVHLDLLELTVTCPYKPITSVLQELRAKTHGVNPDLVLESGERMGFELIA